MTTAGPGPKTSRREVGVGETFDEIEVLVVGLDGAVTEVRREQDRAVVALADRETFVDCARAHRLVAVGRIVRFVDRNDRLGAGFGVPSGDRSVLGGEQKCGG